VCDLLEQLDQEPDLEGVFGCMRIQGGLRTNSNRPKSRNSEQRAESREQRAESREQRTEKREQRTENRSREHRHGVGRLAGKLRSDTL
jgi:hypothetical protein